MTTVEFKSDNCEHSVIMEIFEKDGENQMIYKVSPDTKEDVELGLAGQLAEMFIMGLTSPEDILKEESQCKENSEGSDKKSENVG